VSEQMGENDGLRQPAGRVRGGMKSEMGKAAYWRMNYESAIQALADLIAENTQNVEALKRLIALGDGWVGLDDSHHYGDAILVAVGPDILNALASPSEHAHDVLCDDLRYPRGNGLRCGAYPPAKDEL
jgi:hypothetical protein